MKTRITIARISRISDKAHRFIIQELEKRGIYGIVPSHGGILSFLYIYENITMKELAEKIHRSKPTVTVLVDKLVALGYVLKEKSDADSRVTYIRLTEQGKTFQKDFQEISQSLNERVFQGISETEINMVDPILEKIMHNLS
ncbi:MarR family winged helix-turn-helix transcriptional regulator [Sulfurospirillum sp.]|uniref:MarR family winged helix-turn-helix transcriptional regulator n=1 Tax=Sulfurospirillum sp. TaxID=2053622 RepID=UPI002FDDADF4